MLSIAKKSPLVAMTESKAEVRVLGKLLLLQQNLELLPNREEQVVFIRRALHEVPGLGDVRFCLLGLWLPDCPASVVCTLNNESESPMLNVARCCAVERLNMHSIPLRTARKLYGFMLVTIDDAAAIAPYAPYLVNIANNLATLLEKQAMNLKLQQALSDLEHQIETCKEADQRKDEFIAMLGHELRNPLAPITNAVQIMKRANLPDPTLKLAQEIIERQINHLARLVDDLLDVSRINQGKITLQKAPLDLSAVLNQAIEASQPIIQAHHHILTVSMPDYPLRLEGDSVRLIQVISNLLTNAAKYTPAGGRIWLSVTQEDEQILMRVRDTGIGIAKSLLSQIFDIFIQAERTLDRSQGGLGIGLTISKKIVELHGGRIGVQSEGPGKGSEFMVWLPAREPSQPVTK